MLAFVVVLAEEEGEAEGAGGTEVDEGPWVAGGERPASSPLAVLVLQVPVAASSPLVPVAASHWCGGECCCEGSGLSSPPHTLILMPLATRRVPSSSIWTPSLPAAAGWPLRAAAATDNDPEVAAEGVGGGGESEGSADSPTHVVVSDMPFDAAAAEETTCVCTGEAWTDFTELLCVAPARKSTMTVLRPEAADAGDEAVSGAPSPPSSCTAGAGGDGDEVTEDVDTGGADAEARGGGGARANFARGIGALG